MKTLQFIQTTPEALVQLINDGIKIHLEELKKSFTICNSDELLTREETCHFLKIDSSTLWHWTKQGKVVALGIGNRRYYKKADLLACLKPLSV